MSDDLTSNVSRSEGTPHERLTALADHMLGPLEVEPDVRAIVLLETQGHGGLVFSGYEEDEEHLVVLSLLRHAEAVCKSRGRTLREAFEELGL